MSSKDSTILAVVGTGGVGKTALTIQFLQNQFITSYDPTIEETYRKQIVVDEQTCLLDILDTAGQEEFSAMRDQYLRKGHGFLFVYSIVTKDSQKTLETYYKQIYKIKDELKIPLVLIGNKVDLEGERNVTTEEGIQLSEKYQCPFFETSAKTGKNVEESFFSLVREVRKIMPKKITTNQKKKKKKKCIIL
ncbi:ras-like protein rasd [Anaeramoeba flamelloides]|uniref:Ras-like protein rasd n=1 Tax=Anaeramoeba flamelloides TaxID=1746091 RepID=A0AAV7ZQW7_9EUKA|nr:ras-like protein rasd [Anaeramoeba flamelloides]